MDHDGIVVVSESQLLALLPRAEVQRTEARAPGHLERGEGLLGMLNFAEHRGALKLGRPSKLRLQQ